MNDIVESELIFKVHRLKNSKGEYLPSIQDIASHDITPSWAAAMAYLILDRYISSVEESRQNEFEKQTLYWLDIMLKDSQGSEYTEKIAKLDSMD